MEHLNISVIARLRKSQVIFRTMRHTLVMSLCLVLNTGNWTNCRLSHLFSKIRYAYDLRLAETILGRLGARLVFLALCTARANWRSVSLSA